MARGDCWTCPHCGGDLNRWPGEVLAFEDDLSLPVYPYSMTFNGELDVASLTIGQACQKYPASGYTIDGVYTGFEKETEVISE